MINWIKVEDRLPTNEEIKACSGDFLVTNARNHVRIGYLWENDKVFTDGDFREWPDITHWANLSDINLPNE